MLNHFGWSPTLQTAFAQIQTRGLIPARVIAHHRGLWRLITEQGERSGKLSGRFAAEAAPGAHPVIGDWLAVAPPPLGPDGEPQGEAVIHALLPRSTAFVRRAAGGVQRQVIAANIDLALLVVAATRDFNPRRLERYLVATQESQARPLVVLTKADLMLDRAETEASLAQVCGPAPLLWVSSVTGEGLEALQAALAPGITAALLGTSGAGKSTLLNALAGQDLMATGAVRAGDERGQHTTRHRALFALPSGALIIDTPGMREFGVAAEAESVSASFEDVAEAMTTCRFRNCQHESEPGCGVLAALETGALSPERWANYLKLQNEAAYLARKDDPEAIAAHRRKWKKIHTDLRQRERQKRKPD